MVLLIHLLPGSCLLCQGSRPLPVSPAASCSCPRWPSALGSSPSLCSCCSPARVPSPQSICQAPHPLFQVSFKAPLQSLSGPPSTGNADLFLRLLPSPGRFLHLFTIHPFCTCLVGARHGARCWGHSSDSGSDHGRGLRCFHLLMRALGIREVKDWPRPSQTVHGRPRIVAGSV